MISGVAKCQKWGVKVEGLYRGRDSGVQGQSPAGGLEVKPLRIAESEKHDINFALRITPINAHCPLRSPYRSHHFCNWIFKKYM